MTKKPKPLTWQELYLRVKELDRLYLLAEGLRSDIANVEASVASERLRLREALRRKRQRAWSAYLKLRDTPYTPPPQHPGETK